MLRKLLSIIFFLALLSPGIIVIAQNDQIIASSFRIYKEGGPKRLEQINMVMSPNQNGNETLTFENTSDKENLRLLIYAVDSTTSQNGGLAFKLRNDNQKLVGSWLHFNQEYIDLLPKETKTLDYQISIPTLASPGEYVGGIIAEIVTPQNSSNIKFTSRVATPIFIKIPGEENLNYHLESYNFDRQKNHNCFKFEIHNDGNVFIETKSRIEIVSDNFKQTIDLGEQKIIPNTISSKTINWQKPPFVGKYKANIIVEIFRTDLATGKTTKIDELSNTIEIVIIPTAEILTTLVFFLIIFAIVFMLIFRKELTIKKSVTYTVKKNDGLKDIAKTFKTSWKKIAELNKLKKPYTIKAGQKLKIPKTNIHE